MPIIEIIPGVKVYQGDGGRGPSILFGCPPEIIKHLMNRDIPLPELIIIPDKLYHEGVLQNSTEFPLYFFLFIMGNFQKGGRLAIAGNKRQVLCNRKLLQLSLLGPTIKEYNNIGASPYYRGLYQESRYLAIKDKEGRELTIDNFVKFQYFKEEELDYISSSGEAHIRHKDYNVYEVDGEIIDINFREAQPLAYDLKSNFIPRLPSRFGIDILGGGSGFTPNKPCSAVLLNYNSDYMLLDCPPYLNQSLEARGITNRQVKSIYLTHIHDDHCNMFPLLQFNDKIKFLGTKEIYWMALRKLSLQLEYEMDDLYSYFDFVEMVPYQENEFYGMSIVPHYTVHSIPTTGATFRMKSNGQQSTIVFVGDNKSLKDIEKMCAQGLVSQEKWEYIKKLYTDRFDLLFPDGGMGILHGDPRDSLDSTSERVVFMHLEELPSEFDATFSLARAGKYYSAYADEINSNHSYLVRAMQILQNNYPGISNEWSTAILNDISIRMYNSGDVIMKQGDASQGLIYIILSGKCSVMHHDGKQLRELAIKEAGDFIGEMAAVKHVNERSASIVARTPVILCSFDEKTYYEFLHDEKRIEPMKEMWHIRSELEQNEPFSSFSDFVNERIANAATRREIKQGEVVIKQGSMDDYFYIILSGRFLVEHGSIKVKELVAGDFFGEYAMLTHRLRNASITAIEDSVVLELEQKKINSIIDSTPIFNFYVNAIMRRRSDELQKL